ncbi:hypothetical protein QQ045_012189 [Rhodiola kirilowii]
MIIALWFIWYHRNRVLHDGPILSHVAASNFVKVNCDGSWIEEQNSGGLGVILRDSHGCVLAIAAKYIEHCNSVLECEAEALLLGFITAKNLRVQHVVFESDSKDLVQLINYGDHIGFPKASSIHDIKTMLSRSHYLSVCFTRREANSAADFIARKASSERWNWRILDAIPRIYILVQFL